MTDNEDRDPPRGDPFSAGADEPDETGARWGREGAGGRARISRARTRIAPTDPEVPSAKRRGAIRHQRSLVGLTAVVMGLLSITLALLYRASQQVGTRDQAIPAAPRVPHPPGQTSASSRVQVDGNARTSRAQSNGLREAPLFDDSASDGAPGGSGSAAPKNPPPALDIIRTPPF